jgi:hypothetical protein
MAAGVAPVAQGVAGIRAAVTAAREIMKDLPMGSVGVFTLRDRWLSMAAHRLAQVGCEPARLVHPALRQCTEQERDRLLEAATVFLELAA